MQLLPLKSYHKPARKYQSQGISYISTTFDSSAELPVQLFHKLG